MAAAVAGAGTRVFTGGGLGSAAGADETQTWKCSEEALRKMENYDACKNAKHPLIEAAKRGSLVLVKHFLASETRAKRQDLLNEKDDEGISAFEWAAANGHVEVLEFLLDPKIAPGVDIHTKCGHTIISETKTGVVYGRNDTVGEKAFIAAAKNGQIPALRFLLDPRVVRGVDINSKEGNHETLGAKAFCEAAEAGHLSVLQFLLDPTAFLREVLHEDAGCISSYCGVDIHLKDDVGVSIGAKAFVAAHRHIGILRFLLSQGVKMDEPFYSAHGPGVAAFFSAASCGNVESLEFLRSLTEDFGFYSGTHTAALRLAVEGRLYCGSLTALHLAAEGGHAKALAYLLARGLDINTLTRFEGASPFFTAAANGQIKALEFLLDPKIPGVKGVDITQQFGDGNALHYFIKYHNRSFSREQLLEVANFLISHGINPNDKRGDGYDALSLANMYCPELRAFFLNLKIKSFVRQNYLPITLIAIGVLAVSGEWYKMTRQDDDARA